jgi:hypothetical protein
MTRASRAYTDDLLVDANPTYTAYDGPVNLGGADNSAKVHVSTLSTSQFPR